ncbi:mRNA 3' end processing factor, partial [Linderina pennispora]
MSAEINKDLYRKYRGELNALTFNAKPAITNLTKMADRYKNEAATILSALEDHLRMTSPHMKLPAFYLLDSIAKMVGGTYLYLLNSRVQKLFLDTWQSVNDEVKAKLERVLMTWRNGFEGGKGNLFQPFVLRGIDEQLARLKAKGRREAAIPSNRGDDLLDKLQNTAALARKRAVDSKKMTANGGGANGQPPAKRMRQYNGDAQSVAAPARQSAR